ncbi:MAG TPA: hypothetical protein VLT91_08785 [Rhizomicrobium sp.]|nr:hypothetical protein [Rhizomicrobium sp.]
MLLTAFYFLTAAVLLGSFVALSHIGLMRWRWWPGVIHGALGIAGLTLLFFSLGGPPRGAEHGVQSFTTIAAWIAVAGLAVALVYAALQVFAKKRVAWLVGAHVTVAITAYLFLMAFVSLG